MVRQYTSYTTAYTSDHILGIGCHTTYRYTSVLPTKFALTISKMEPNMPREMGATTTCGEMGYWDTRPQLVVSPCSHAALHGLSDDDGRKVETMYSTRA